MKRFGIRPFWIGTAAVASILFLVQCGVGGTKLNIGSITFGAQTSQVFDQYCVTCHKSGGIAPFALTTYDEVFARRGMISAAIGARIMPPWGAEEAIGCPRIKNSHWLPQKKIEQLQYWIADGAPQGEAIPPLQGSSVGFEIENPDFVAPAAMPHSPVFAGGNDSYPCILMKGNAGTGGFLDELAFKPGNVTITHHAIVKRLTDPALAGAFDSIYGTYDSFPCGAIPGIADPTKFETTLLWAAGGKKLDFSSYQAKPYLPAGIQRFVIEMHYSAANLVGNAPQSDLSEIRAKFSPPGNFSQVVMGGNVGGFPAIPAPQNFGLPPNTANLVVPSLGYVTILPTSSYRIVLGVLPHMHKFGRQVTSRVVRANGNIECLISVPKYNFNWQWTYMFETPVILGPGDTIDTTFVFDTTGHMDYVGLGEQTNDEMAFFFTLESPMPGI